MGTEEMPLHREISDNFFFGYLYSAQALNPNPDLHDWPWYKDWYEQTTYIGQNSSSLRLHSSLDEYIKGWIAYDLDNFCKKITSFDFLYTFSWQQINWSILYNIYDRIKTFLRWNIFNFFHILIFEKYKIRKPFKFLIIKIYKKTQT